MYGSRSVSMISTLESHKFNCSSVGGLVWLFRRSTSSENAIELPASGVVEMGVSEFISVDKDSSKRNLYMRLHSWESRSAQKNSQIADICPSLPRDNER